MNIMELPTGVRALIITDVQTHNTPEPVAERFAVKFTAVPTSRIKYCYGKWRRFFVDSDVEFYPGNRTIWLSCDDPPKHDLTKEAKKEKPVNV